MMEGCAVGDAWGYPCEFTRRYVATVAWPRAPKITDDTQMLLATAAALVDAPTTDDVMDTTRRLYELWRVDEDNDRAPGIATMNALKRWAHDPATLLDATSVRSKGAGALMRVAPIGFVDGRTARLELTMRNAVLTHGHETSTTASLALVELIAALRTHETKALESPAAFVIEWLTEAVSADGASDLACDLEAAAARVPEFTELAHARHYDDIESYLRSGLADVRVALASAMSAVNDGTYRDGVDIATVVGSQGTAEVVLASALGAISLGNSPTEALERIVGSAGDSDTIGAVAGAILGTMHPGAFADLAREIEDRYVADIDRLALTVPLTITASRPAVGSDTSLRRLSWRSRVRMLIAGRR